ncbi:MAG: hypothetical protein KDB88_11065 [Flavobacteriales bacterium]|nr:hypothetical protein [Flavobacteriales bacterium]
MTKLLIVLVLVLGILAVAQLARVYELTSRLRGKREEEISPADNRMNAMLMWLFVVLYFASFIWLMVRYGDKMLPVAASQHGVELDRLLNFNWIIIISVFFITNTLLFYFAGKYAFDKGRRAFYYPHNNKLELLWTTVPAAFLAVIIIYGLRTWNRITEPATGDAIRVELYAKQFDWTARYPGKDGMLGATDFRLINGTNPLGIVTETSVATRMDEIEADIKAAEGRISNEILPDGKVDELQEEIAHLRRMLERISNLRTVMLEDIKEKGDASPYKHGSDDLVIKEFHLPIRQQADLLIRSRDVIHSAYIPHMRAQMNAVPGMTTRFKMVPTITTDSMRIVTGNEAFDFVLLCNKICGASHYNMQMPLVVESADAYDAWMAEMLKKPFEGGDAPEEERPAEGTEPMPMDTVVAEPMAQLQDPASMNK